jgi:hypothetical protein
MIAIEETITTGLGDLGIVDGHDIGSSEMNVFIHTNDPKLAFERAKALLAGRNDLHELTAGYRDFNEDEYTPIYPKGLKHFSVA